MRCVMATTCDYRTTSIATCRVGVIRVVMFRRADRVPASVSVLADDVMWMSMASLFARDEFLRPPPRTSSRLRARDASMRRYVGCAGIQGADIGVVARDDARSALGCTPHLGRTSEVMPLSSTRRGRRFRRVVGVIGGVHGLHPL